MYQLRKRLLRRSRFSGDDNRRQRVSPLKAIGWILRFYSFLGIIQAELKPSLLKFKVRWWRCFVVVVIALMTLAQLAILMTSEASVASGQNMDWKEMMKNWTSLGETKLLFDALSFRAISSFPFQIWQSPVQICIWAMDSSPAHCFSTTIDMRVIRKSWRD